MVIALCDYNFPVGVAFRNITCDFTARMNVGNCENNISLWKYREFNKILVLTGNIHQEI